MWSLHMRNGRRALSYAFFLLPAVVLVTAVPAARASADPCGPGSNPVQCENSQPGSPMSSWYAPNAYGQIQGFTAQQSVVPGDTLQFKVNSPGTYKVNIFRLGWYGG